MVTLELSLETRTRHLHPMLAAKHVLRPYMIGKWPKKKYAIRCSYGVERG